MLVGRALWQTCTRGYVPPHNGGLVPRGLRAGGPASWIGAGPGLQRSVASRTIAVTSAASRSVSPSVNPIREPGGIGTSLT